MKTPHKRFVLVGSFLVVVAIIVPVAFMLWTFLGPQSYRAVAVVSVTPFISPAFERAVRIASSVGPSVRVEQYWSTTLFHASAAAATPQIATQQTDAAAKRMLSSLAEEPGDGPTLFERPQPPLKPYHPTFRGMMVVTTAVSAGFGLAGIVLLVAAFISRQRES